MVTVKQQNGPSRRNILKGATLAAAASCGIMASVSAKPRSAGLDCIGNGIDDDQYLPIPEQAPATEGVLPLSGGAGLYFWDTGGDGPVVVFSHPGSGSALSWPYQQPVFAANGFRTIAYSRRGHYGSPAGLDSDAGNFSDDLDALMAHLNVTKFHLVGLAAGGFTVSDYAVSYPEKLHSIVIACSKFGLWDKNISERTSAISPEGFGSMPTEFRELSPAYRWAYPEGTEAWVAMSKQSRNSGARVRQGAKSTVSWESLLATKLPIFLIAGGADLYQPPTMMRAAARQLPGCESLVIPEVGHAPQWENPLLFNQVVMDFCQRHTISAPR